MSQFSCSCFQNQLLILGAVISEPFKEPYQRACFFRTLSKCRKETSAYLANGVEAIAISWKGKAMGKQQSTRINNNRVLSARWAYPPSLLRSQSQSYLEWLRASVLCSWDKHGKQVCAIRARSAGRLTAGKANRQVLLLAQLTNTGFTACIDGLLPSSLTSFFLFFVLSPFLLLTGLSYWRAVYANC